MTQSEVWKHVKSGRLYIIIDPRAKYEETGNRCVVYKSLITGQVWVRPLDEFMDGRFVNIAGDELRV